MKPKKPIRITTFCVHGEGRSPSVARSLVRALSLEPHIGITQLPHDKFYKTPDGRMVQIKVRRVGNMGLTDVVSAPVLKEYDIKDSHWVISNYCHNPIFLKNLGRSELEEPLTQAEHSGKLISDPGSHDDIRRYFNKLVGKS
jgi:hypothetical protein